MLDPNLEQARQRFQDSAESSIAQPVEEISPLTKAYFVLSGNEEYDIRRRDEVQTLISKGLDTQRLATLVRLNQGENTVQSTRQKLQRPNKALWNGYISAMTFGALLSGGMLLISGLSKESIVVATLTLIITNGAGGWIGSMMRRNAYQLRSEVPNLLDEPLRKAYQIASDIRSELKKEKMGPEATEKLFQLRLKDAADDLNCQAKAYFEAAAEIGRGEM